MEKSGKKYTIPNNYITIDSSPTIEFVLSDDKAVVFMNTKTPDNNYSVGLNKHELWMIIKTLTDLMDQMKSKHEDNKCK